MSDPSPPPRIQSDQDPDLRDVFALLYADDDWTFNTSDTEDEPEAEDDGLKTAGGTLSEKDQSGIGSEVEGGVGEPHPPLGSFIPDADLERIERSIDVDKEGDEVAGGEGALIDVKRYSRKRFLDAIDSLFFSAAASSSNIPSSNDEEGQTKRRRIYSRPKVLNDSSLNISIITSTQPVPSLPDPTTYAPFSPLALLSRFRTYRIHTYPYPSLYPEALSPINAVLNGWINDSRERLCCGYCRASWSLTGLAEIVDEGVRNEVARRLSQGFKGRHMSGCAWRVRSSPDELYAQLRNLLHPPISSHLAPLAERLSTALPYPSSSIPYTSPLTPSQQSTLLSSLKHHVSSSSSASSPPSNDLGANLALFGWYPYYPKSPSSSSAHIDSNSVKSKEQTEIVCCRFCERRVGLWSFGPRSSGDEKGSPSRSFDLVNEHLGWCPIRPQPRSQSRLQSGKDASDNNPWWTDCALLREKTLDEAGSKVGVTDNGGTKGWLIVSDKLEKKPWRKIIKL
ncbi:hypothetical protein IAT40_005932 [Kwoniella sp. CBS 6097]